METAWRIQLRDLCVELLAYRERIEDFKDSHEIINRSLPLSFLCDLHSTKEQFKLQTSALFSRGEALQRQTEGDSEGEDNDKNWTQKEHGDWTEAAASIKSGLNWSVLQCLDLLENQYEELKGRNRDLMKLMADRSRELMEKQINNVLAAADEVVTSLTNPLPSSDVMGTTAKPDRTVPGNGEKAIEAVAVDDKKADRTLDVFPPLSPSETRTKAALRKLLHEQSRLEIVWN